LARGLGSALVALALAASGCGGDGASAGATVSVFVAAPLCKEAQRELSAAGGEAGDLKVHAVCLPVIETKGGVDLAASGRNARRATEDSTAIAYLEAPGPGSRFSRSIVESADIAWIETSSGSTAVRRVLRAIDDAGSSSPRDAVLQQVG